MKNSFFFFFIKFFLIFNLNFVAAEINISSSSVTYDDENKITIFKDNVTSTDEKGNKIFSDYIKYNRTEEIIETRGNTKIVTAENYEVYGSDIIFNNKKNLIYSNKKTKIIDQDGNNIMVEMFNYSTLTKIFFSKGNIKLKDINNNDFNFSEIYIDEQKRKIIGSDIKAFLNQPDISINAGNDPRFFANTMSLTKETNNFEKGVFTYCKNRGDDKCPPWTLQSQKIKHDLTSKTIYYDNVVLKVYDFPIFFSPKFSHPDPTVKRRSGLLAPALSNSTILGSGFSTPYFLSISQDKDITFIPKFYVKEEPLLLAEYRQDFANSFLIVDSGFSQGYKKKTKKKTDGNRAHFFSNFFMNLKDEPNKKSSLEINIEKVSNDTYLKVYDIKNSLADKDKTVLVNKLDFSYQDKDLYIGLTPSAYEDTSKLGNLRHEYLLPLAIEKNIFTSERYGFLDLGSDVRLRNYDTNKQTNFLVNNFKWKSNNWLNSLGVENYFEGLARTVNYAADNTTEFKNEKTNSEVYSALGYFSKLSLYKEDLIKKNFHSLVPKVLLRYAPGHMRKTVQNHKLYYSNLFDLNKIKELDVLEPGLSTSIGFKYQKSKISKSKQIGEEKLSFAVGQVVNLDENQDVPSSTSLDQRFSDIVGETKYNINSNTNFNYNFAIDQSYKKINYNEVGLDYKINRAKFNLDFLQERNHIGNTEYIKTGFDFNPNSSTELSFNSKRNLLTNSSEFYNLSYNYINDCLKAGIAYRREFYTDRDIEPANSLMFTISIVPFAEINVPGLSK